MKSKPVPIELPRIDADTQSRIKINDETVADYVALIEASDGEWPFPPLDIFHDGTDHYVADGFHRLLAALKTKRGSVPCNIHKGTARDARIFSMTANDKHGLRMTRADKRACVEWLLDTDATMTQAAIAEAAGVTARTVRTIAADRRHANAPPKPDPPNRTSNRKTSATQSGGSKSEPIDVDSEPVDDTSEAPDPPKGKGKPPRKIDRSAWFKQWEQAIGPLVRLVDKIGAGVGESGGESHACIQGQLQAATEEMQEWMGQ